MKKNAKSLGLILSALMALGACAPGGLSEVNNKQCPPVDILATADTLPLGEAKAKLTGASLTCYIDKTRNNLLLAKVTLRGAAAAGTALPVFVAALDRENKVVARTQYKLTAVNERFALTLPEMDYGKKNDDRKPRLVAGFVLSDRQLADNRQAYRKKLGLTD